MKLGKNGVQLRKLVPGDVQDLTRIANNKKVWLNLRDLFPHPYLPSHGENFINRVKGENPQVTFAIIYREEFCGVIGVVPQSDVYSRSVELGFWLGEEFWGKGIGTVSVGLITDYAFAKLDIVRVFAGIFDFNIPSMRVLEKNGFEREGISKKAIFKNGKFLDEVRFAKIL